MRYPTGDVEIPSDLQGVLYKSVASGGGIKSIAIDIANDSEQLAIFPTRTNPLYSNVVLRFVSHEKFALGERQKRTLDDILSNA
jgi:hypothetical protein